MTALLVLRDLQTWVGMDCLIRYDISYTIVGSFHKQEWKLHYGRDGCDWRARRGSLLVVF